LCFFFCWRNKNSLANTNLSKKIENLSAAGLVVEYFPSDLNVRGFQIIGFDHYSSA
jgi:hypothetical protein